MKNNTDSSKPKIFMNDFRKNILVYIICTVIWLVINAIFSPLAWYWVVLTELFFTVTLLIDPFLSRHWEKQAFGDGRCPICGRKLTVRKEEDTVVCLCPDHWYWEGIYYRFNWFNPLAGPFTKFDPFWRVNTVSMEDYTLTFLLVILGAIGGLAYNIYDWATGSESVFMNIVWIVVFSVIITIGICYHYYNRSSDE